MIHRIKKHLFIITKIDSDVLPPFATERQEYLLILERIVSFLTCSLLKEDGFDLEKDSPAAQKLGFLNSVSSPNSGWLDVFFLKNPTFKLGKF